MRQRATAWDDLLHSGCTEKKKCQQEGVFCPLLSVRKDFFRSLLRAGGSYKKSF